MMMMMMMMVVVMAVVMVMILHMGRTVWCMEVVNFGPEVLISAAHVF